SPATPAPFRTGCARARSCSAPSARRPARARAIIWVGRRSGRSCHRSRASCSRIWARMRAQPSRRLRVCGCATTWTSSSYKARMDRIEQLRKFIVASPDDPFPRYALALELKGKGDAAAAAGELRELLGRKPDYLAAYLQLGMLLDALDKVSEAREILV